MHVLFLSIIQCGFIGWCYWKELKDTHGAGEYRLLTVDHMMAWLHTLPGLGLGRWSTSDIESFRLPHTNQGTNFQRGTSRRLSGRHTTDAKKNKLLAEGLADGNSNKMATNENNNSKEGQQWVNQRMTVANGNGEVWGWTLVCGLFMLLSSKVPELYYLPAGMVLTL